VVKNRFSGAKRMRLTWSLVRIPAGMKAYLFDKSSNLLIDLQESDDYVFTMGTGERYMTLLVREEATGLPMPQAELPREISLFAYPNPFNTTLNIRYTIPKASDVEISLYNMMGENVRTLVRAHADAGSYMIVWDCKDDSGKPVGTSIYFIRFRVGNEVKVFRSVLIR
ncbi:MAG: T9SS type A sorting domain-containing protein, partial [bacterium]